MRRANINTNCHITPGCGWRQRPVWQCPLEITYDAIRCHYRSDPAQTQPGWLGVPINNSNPAVRWRQVIRTTLRGWGFVSQAELQFTSLTHDESRDRAQLSLSGAEPQISDHLPSTPLKTMDRTPQSAWTWWDGQVKSEYRCTHFTSAVLRNQKTNQKKLQCKIWQAARVYFCRIIFFLSLLSYRSGSSSVMLLHSWSLKQRFDSSPSHPLPALSPSEPACQYRDTKWCSHCQRETAACLSHFAQSHCAAWMSTNYPSTERRNMEKEVYSRGVSRRRGKLNKLCRSWLFLFREDRKEKADKRRKQWKLHL